MTGILNWFLGIALGLVFLAIVAVPSNADIQTRCTDPAKIPVVRATILGRNQSYIHPEELWDGGEVLTLEIDPGLTSVEWDTNADFSSGLPDRLAATSATDETYGWDAHKRDYFKDVSLVTRYHLVFTLTSGIGIVLAQQQSIGINGITALLRNAQTIDSNVYCADTPTFLEVLNTTYTPRVEKYTKGAFEGQTENDVRGGNVFFEVYLWYNRFKSTTGVTTTAAADGVEWTYVLLDGGRGLKGSLPAIPAYQIDFPIPFVVDVSTVPVVWPTGDQPMENSQGTFNIQPSWLTPVLGVCTCSSQTNTEAMVRSDTSFPFIAITIPKEDALVVTDAADKRAKEALVESAGLSSKLRPGELTVFPGRVFIQGQTIYITIGTNPNYDISEVDTVSFTLPGSVLPSKDRGCGTATCEIQPSPGTLVKTDPMAWTITESAINDGNVRLGIELQYDEFVTKDVEVVVIERSELVVDPFVSSDVFIPNLDVSIDEGRMGNSTMMWITVPQTENYNIPLTSREVIEFRFAGSMTLSGLKPQVPDPLQLIIEPARVAIRVLDDEGLRSEDLWDGDAVLRLRLVGDVWKSNAALWDDADSGPLFTTSSSPEETHGFEANLQRLIQSGYATVLPRIVELRFSSAPGFVLKNTEFIVLSRVGSLVTDARATSISTFFRVNKAERTSTQARWGGLPFEDRVTEADVRRDGFNISLESRYDILSIEPNIVSALFVRSRSLAPYVDLLTVVVDPDMLYKVHFVFPPLVSYDIRSDETINITASSRFFFNNNPPPQPDNAYTIAALRDETFCTMSVKPIGESAVRHGSPVARFKLQVINDVFVSDPSAHWKLVAAIQTSFQKLQFRPIGYSEREMEFEIVHDEWYDIVRDDMITITVPRELTYNRELCPQFAPRQSTLDIPVHVEAGRLSAEVPPEISEQDIRDGSLTIPLLLTGETFAQSNIPPKITMLKERKDDAGFMSSVAANTLIMVDFQNRTMANLVIPRNKSFDITSSEHLEIAIPSIAVASRIPPLSVMPVIVINVVKGRLDFNLNNVTVTEHDFAQGKIELDLVLFGDRFDYLTAVRDVRDSFSSILQVPDNVPIPPQGNTFIGRVSQLMPTSAFNFTDNNRTLKIRFAADPGFDIYYVQTVIFTVPATAVVSELRPDAADGQFDILPSNGRVHAIGPALKTGARQIWEGGLWYAIVMINDIWKFDLNAYARQLCPFTACITRVDSSGRILNVTFLANESFRLLQNRQYHINVSRQLTQGDLQPIGTVMLDIAVTAGVLSFAGFETSGITEGMVREGKLPEMHLRLLGDTFLAIDTMAECMAARTTCTGSDQFGFCSRIRHLLAGVDSKLVGPSHAVIVFQPDDLYDIYRLETVNITLGSSCVASGFPPSESFGFDITPTPGGYFLSGPLVGLTERDMVGLGSSHRDLSLVFSLRGERFSGSVKQVLQHMIVSSFSDIPQNASSERGFAWNKNLLLSATASTYSNDNRVLIVKILPVKKYDITRKETIVIPVPREATMSGLEPTALSPATGFTVDPAGGVISISPTITTSDIIRTTGVDIAITIRSDTWRAKSELSLARTRPFCCNVTDVIRGSSAPLEEPKGLNALLSEIVQRNASVTDNPQPVDPDNPEHILIIRLLPTPKYQPAVGERLLIPIPVNWTTSGLAPDPVMLQVAVEINVPTLIAVVRTAKNVTVDLKEWSTNMTQLLGIPGGLVVFPSPLVEETRVPSSTVSTFWRISFQILPSEEKSATEAMNFIMNLSPEFLEQNLMVELLFDSAETPSDAKFIVLNPEGVDTPAPIETTTSDGTTLYVIAGILVFLLIVVGVCFKVKRGARKSGVNRFTVEFAERRKQTKDGDDAFGSKGLGGALLDGNDAEEMVELQTANELMHGVPTLSAIPRQPPPPAKLLDELFVSQTKRVTEHYDTMYEDGGYPLPPRQRPTEARPTRSQRGSSFTATSAEQLTSQVFEPSTSLTMANNTSSGAFPPPSESSRPDPPTMSRQYPPINTRGKAFRGRSKFDLNV